MGIEDYIRLSEIERDLARIRRGIDRLGRDIDATRELRKAARTAEDEGNLERAIALREEIKAIFERSRAEREA